MEHNETIGNKILALRKERNVTQASLGAFLNISYQAVSKWERDESCPDFQTLSKIAQFFNVPISYFEVGGEETAATAAVTAPVAPPNKQMLGVCKDCGKVVYEGEEGVTIPALICKPCVERRKRIEEAKQQARRKEEQKRKEEQVRAQEQRKVDIKHGRNRGLIVSGIITAALLIAALIKGWDYFGAMNLVYSIVGAVVWFTFIAQLFWDGAVADCASASWHFIPPGIIFEFSLDGLKFLIAMKILFAILKLFIVVASSIVCICAAMLISPFTFVPALIRVNSGDLLD